MAKSIKDEESERINDSIVNKSDSETLYQIIRKAELLLTNIGIRINANDIIFKIVNQNRLKELRPDIQNVVGLTCPISIEGKQHIIWLLENQSYIFLLSVVAHEMGHTWCRDNKVKFDQMQEEGFCELLAYHVLSTQFSKLGNSWKTAMIQNPDPIYGDGLRFMRNILDRFNGSWFKYRAFIRLSYK